MCRIKQLKPNYINIRIKGNKPQDRKTTANAVRYRLKQEIKFLYCKKQNLNHQLYKIQLKCMHHCNGMWQHIQSSIDSQVNDFMDKTYPQLNKKLINSAFVGKNSFVLIKMQGKTTIKKYWRWFETSINDTYPGTDNVSFVGLFVTTSIQLCSNRYILTKLRKNVTKF